LRSVLPKCRYSMRSSGMSTYRERPFCGPRAPFCGLARFVEPESRPSRIRGRLPPESAARAVPRRRSNQRDTYVYSGAFIRDRANY
jgi:hypothetical protein